MSKKKGSIERRGEYQFRASYTLDGKKFRSTHETFDQAKEWLDKQLRLVRTGRHGVALEMSQMTLADAISRYEDSPGRADPYDMERKLRSLRRHLEEAGLLFLNFAGLQTSDIAKYRNFRLRYQMPNGRLTSPTTVGKELSHLSMIFKTARNEWGFDGLDNPVSPGIRPRITPPQNRRIKPEQWESLLRAARVYSKSTGATANLELILRLAMVTAMRLGELAELRWENVDLDHRAAYIPAEHEKTRRGRSVPLSPAAIAVLEKLGVQQSGLVCGVRKSTIRTAWSRIRRRAGVTTRYHDIRHEAISRSVETAHQFGLNELELMMMSGHSTASMLKRYTHLYADRVAEKLAKTSDVHLVIRQ
jgi:integrase